MLRRAEATVSAYLETDAPFFASGLTVRRRASFIVAPTKLGEGEVPRGIAAKNQGDRLYGIFIKRVM
jgi:hypothetical protein